MEPKRGSVGLRLPFFPDKPTRYEGFRVLRVWNLFAGLGVTERRKAAELVSSPLCDQLSKLRIMIREVLKRGARGPFLTHKKKGALGQQKQ